MTCADTCVGLERVWYRFAADPDGNVELWATADGFGHLARYFVKLARTGKVSGFHGHSPLESGHYIVQLTRGLSNCDACGITLTYSPCSLAGAFGRNQASSSAVTELAAPVHGRAPAEAHRRGHRSSSPDEVPE
jgi:hypothetical protein